MSGPRDMLGEWHVDPPKPSPGPWTFREARERDRGGITYSFWVVLDANGKRVCECANAMDAQHIVRNGPGTEAETGAGNVAAECGATTENMFSEIAGRPDQVTCPDCRSRHRLNTVAAVSLPAVCPACGHSPSANGCMESVREPGTWECRGFGAYQVGGEVINVLDYRYVNDTKISSAVIGVTVVSAPADTPPEHPMPWRWEDWHDVNGTLRLRDAAGDSLIRIHDDKHSRLPDAYVRAVTERAGSMEALLRRWVIDVHDGDDQLVSDTESLLAEIDA